MTTRKQIEEAKAALDKIIKKSRVHLYKPIQIAEILYRHRVHKDVDVTHLMDYRNRSKLWRDQVTRILLRRVCTSSQKFQDNLFEANALPPELIAILAKENIRSKGGVEKYIYDSFSERQKMVAALMRRLAEATIDDFDVEAFIGSFVRSPGLRRSVDKAFEIVVYALFSVIVKHIEATVTLRADASKIEIVRDFEDFTKAVLGIDGQHLEISVPARLYRVGVTNAADRGIDMWANFGPAVQVKHLSFTLELAEDIMAQLTADQVVIVCLQAEADGIERILTQLGMRERIRGVITERQLIEWYEKCLRGKYAPIMGNELLEALRREFAAEFPGATAEFQDFYDARGYNKLL